MFYGFPQVPYAVFIFWDTLFFCVSLVGWILLSCLQVLIFFSTSSSPLLNPLKELLSFIIVFFSSVLSVWYFLTFSISLLKFSFCSCIVFLFSFKHQSVFSCSSLNFFKMIIQNLCQTDHRSHFLGSVIGDFLVSFGGVMFSWLFMILVTLYWCLHIWGTRHLQSLQTGFHKESPLSVSIYKSAR